MAKGTAQMIEDANKNIKRSTLDALRWAIFMPTALNVLGRFRVQCQGENEGRFNIRTHGIDPLIASVRAFAVSKGIFEHNTVKCIFQLRIKRVISSEMESVLVEAHECFMSFLSGEHSDWVHPSLLTRYERTQIREAMKVVELFQKYIFDGPQRKSWLTGLNSKNGAADGLAADGLERTVQDTDSSESTSVLSGRGFDRRDSNPQIYHRGRSPSR